MEFIEFITPQTLASQLASRIVSAGQKAPSIVFLSGGSNVPILADVTNAVGAYAPVSYTLADERHGVPGHQNSNWQQLLAAGARFSETSYPVLQGGTLQADTAAFNAWLDTAAQSHYKIGIFGMGLDGHVAGLLPASPALASSRLADCFAGPDFMRITITPAMIARLNEAYLVFKGADKLALAREIMAGRRPAPARALLAVPSVVSYYMQ